MPRRPLAPRLHAWLLSAIVAGALATPLPSQAAPAVAPAAAHAVTPADAGVARGPAADGLTASSTSGTRMVRVAGSTLPGFRVGADRPARVAIPDRPYAYAGLPELRNPARPYDAAGIIQYERGGRLYDHPVVQATNALGLIGGYRNSGDQRFRAAAVAVGERMLSYAVRSRGALYLPYPFDFDLHGKPEYTLKAPWYSGMAQGQALSTFVGLYEITGEQRWREAADATFASFLNPKAPGVPWVVEVDDGLLWFEEYVGEHTDRAYNGHTFGVYGVYDYWWLTGDERARQVFLGGVHASRVIAEKVRVPGRTSRYCLNHEVHSSTYHEVHISQLYKLYELTGSADLARLADRFQADTPAGYRAGPGRLAKGRHTVVTRTADGRIGTVTRTGPRAAETVRIGLRTWLADRSGVWLRIDSGTLRGKWVQERPGVAYTVGVRDAAAFRPARTAVLPAGTHVGYVVEAHGRVVARRTVRLRAASGALVDGRQTRDGRSYLRVRNGAFAGLLVPAAGIRLP